VFSNGELLLFYVELL